MSIAYAFPFLFTPRNRLGGPLGKAGIMVKMNNGVGGALKSPAGAARGHQMRPSAVANYNGGGKKRVVKKGAILQMGGALK